MVKALDAVPYNEKQWGHWLARKGLGVSKDGKRR